MFAAGLICAWGGLGIGFRTATRRVTVDVAMVCVVVVAFTTATLVEVAATVVVAVLVATSRLGVVLAGDVEASTGGPFPPPPPLDDGAVLSSCGTDTTMSWPVDDAYEESMVPSPSVSTERLEAELKPDKTSNRTIVCGVTGTSLNVVLAIRVSPCHSPTSKVNVPVS